MLTREQFPEGGTAFTLVGFVLAVTSVSGAKFWLQMRFHRAVTHWLFGAAIGWVLILQFALPALEPIRPAKPIADWLRTNAPKGVRLIAADYKEAGLYFYCQSTVQTIGGSAVRPALESLKDLKTPTAILISDTRWNEFAEDLKLPPKVSVRFSGKYFMFQRGKWIRLFIVGNW